MLCIIVDMDTICDAVGKNKKENIKIQREIYNKVRR